MGKALYKENLLQGKRVQCFFSRDDRQEELCIHHIYRNSYRDKSTEYGCWIWLRPDWHNLSNYAIHSDYNLELRLQAMCQLAFEDKYSHEEFIDLFNVDYVERFKNRFGSIHSIVAEWKQRKLVIEHDN